MDEGRHLNALSEKWLRFVKSYAPDFPTHEQLDNLRYYKYAAVDKSYITKYILSHYWNWAITLFPLWIAPNLITLIGLGFMVANVLLVFVFVPDLGLDGPSWIYFSFAAGLWLYSTFDNVDGKQARRTGTSSPLGELFDHGCDALNTTFVAILQCAALGLGHSPQAVILFITTAAGFYLSTAEEYYTEVLYLGYVNGPTEGIILTCLAFLWSGFYGAASWHVPLQDVSGMSWLASLLPENTTAATLFVWSTVFLFLTTICPTSLYSIYNACQRKNISGGQAIVTVLFPIVALGLAEYCWATSPYSIILTQQHAILFGLTGGVLFGLIASSIILAHLTKTPYPNLSGFIAPLIFGGVLINTPLLIGITIIPQWLEFPLLFLIFTGACIFYAGWVTLVIDAFCKHLGIRCLVIGKDRSSDQSLQSQEEGRYGVGTSGAYSQDAYRTFD